MSKKRKNEAPVIIYAEKLHIHMDERMFSINRNNTFCGDTELEGTVEEKEEAEELPGSLIGTALEVSHRTGIDYATVMKVLMEEENCLWDKEIDEKLRTGAGKGECYE